MIRIHKDDYLRLLWYFHRFDKDSFRKNRRCNPPYNNAPRPGIFASRSPIRHNPLASTVVKVLDVDKIHGVLEVIGFDGFPGTEIFQGMYYQPSRARVEGTTLPSWVLHWTDYKSFNQPMEILPENLTCRKDIPCEDEKKIYCRELEEADNSEEEYDNRGITVHTACIHNLKNLTLTIPKEKITLITGVSGSGKSSLVFDTLFIERQKQFVDLVLSNQMQNKALAEGYFDRITGLQPSIAIEQCSLGADPRSIVGSVTRIADVMKLLFTALGERHCPICHSRVDELNVCGECGEILFGMTPNMFSYNHPDYICPICKGLCEEMKIEESLIVEHPEKSLLDNDSSLYGNLRKHRKKPNANWIRGEILALADNMKVELDQPFRDLPEKFQASVFLWFRRT